MTPPSPPWSRASATGTCSSAKPARARSAIRSLTEIARTCEPQTRSGLRVHFRPPGRRRAQRSVVHHGLRRCGGSDATEAKPDLKPGEKPSNEDGRQIEDPRLPGPDRPGRRDDVRDAAQGRKPVGQERGQGRLVLITEMRKGAKLVIKAASLRGHQSIDAYSLTGFAERWTGSRRNARGSRAAEPLPTRSRLNTI